MLKVEIEVKNWFHDISVDWCSQGNQGLQENVLLKREPGKIPSQTIYQWHEWTTMCFKKKESAQSRLDMSLRKQMFEQNTASMRCHLEEADCDYASVKEAVDLHVQVSGTKRLPIHLAACSCHNDWQLNVLWGVKKLRSHDCSQTIVSRLFKFFSQQSDFRYLALVCIYWELECAVGFLVSNHTTVTPCKLGEQRVLSQETKHTVLSGQQILPTPQECWVSKRQLQ